MIFSFIVAMNGRTACMGGKIVSMAFSRDVFCRVGHSPHCVDLQTCCKKQALLSAVRKFTIDVMKITKGI